MKIVNVNNYPVPVTEKQYVQEREATENGRDFAVFNALLPETITLVFASMDYPTQMAFSWTCKTYCRLYFQPERFDRFKFMDKCAKLGYRKLIEESVVAHEMAVDEMTICKAARLGYSYIELWESFLRTAYRRHFFESFFNKAAKHAARGGHVNLSAQLVAISRQAQDRIPTEDECYANGAVHWPPEKLIFHFAQGGHLPKALALVERLSDAQKASMSRQKFIHILFQGAAKSVSLPVVTWCLTQNGDVLAKEINVIMCCPGDGQQTCLNFLMRMGMKHGIVECCRKAIEKGWRPSEQWPISSLKETNLCFPKFIAGSDHLACIQYLDTQFEDLVETAYYSTGMNTDGGAIPRWADLEGLSWLHAKGYFPNLQITFDRYCSRELDIEKDLKAILQSKISMSQLVDWFVGKGIKITPEAYFQALFNYRLDLVNALWENDPSTLPDDALTKFLKQAVRERFSDRVNCPFKRAKALYKIMTWLLERGQKLEEGQGQCDAFARALMHADRRAAQMFCSYRDIKPHISEQCRNEVFARPATQSSTLEVLE